MSFKPPSEAANVELDAIAALAGNGMIAKTGANTAAARTLTGTANQVTILNPDGVAGNPTFSLPQDIATTSTPTFLGATLTAALKTAKGASFAAANNLTLGTDGNHFVVTGNTQINAITIAQLTAGQSFVLQFTGTPTIKHNTAGGAGTAKIKLDGQADLVSANGLMLKLIYDGTDVRELTRAFTGA